MLIKPFGLLKAGAASPSFDPVAELFGASEEGAYFVADPANTAINTDGTGGQVSLSGNVEWFADLSGNGHHARNIGTGSSAPTLEQETGGEYYLNAATNNLFSAATITGLDNVDIYMCFLVRTLDSMLFNVANSAASSTMLAVGDNGTNATSVTRNTGYNAATGAATPPVVAELIWTHSTTTGELFVDGVSAGTSAASAFSTLDRIALLGAGDVSPGTGTGKFTAALVRAGIPTAQQRTDLRDLFLSFAP